MPAQQPAAVPPAGESFDAGHYAVTLDLDVSTGAISGKERIELTVRQATASLVFDSGATFMAAAYKELARGRDAYLASSGRSLSAFFDERVHLR